MMKRCTLVKIVLSAITLTAVLLAVFTITLADDGWTYEEELTDINFYNTKYETVVYDQSTQNFYLSYVTPVSGQQFTETLSFEEYVEEGFEYKLVWRARNLQGESKIDYRKIPSDGTWGSEYTTSGLTLKWDGLTGCRAEIDYIKLYKKDIEDSQWVYQGEMNYNTNYYSGKYHDRKWDLASENFILRYTPPAPSNYFENYELSFSELQHEGYEYKMVWRAKTLWGTCYLDKRLIPTNEWSPEFTTYGLTIDWSGKYSTKVEVDYVKVYARKIIDYTGVSGYWKFRNGLAKDSSGNDNHGIKSSVVSSSDPGIIDQGLKLDGNTYVEIPHSDELNFNNEDFTISFWYKTDQESANGVFLDKTLTINGKTSGYIVCTENSSIKSILYTDEGHYVIDVSDALKTDNKWHYVVIRYMKDYFPDAEMFQDGDRLYLSFTEISSNSTVENNSALRIGENFIGSIDEVVIYKKALLYAEILDIYNKISDNDQKALLHINLDNNITDNSITNNLILTTTGYVPKFEHFSDLYKNAAIFDGQNPIKVTNNSAINMGTNDFSVSCWFKTTSTKGTNTLIDKRQDISGKTTGYLLGVYNRKGIVFQMSDPNSGFYNYIYNGTSYLNDGNWHFVTVSVDRDSTSGVKIYIDGERKYTGNATYRQGDISNLEDLLIGGHSYQSSNNFVGAIDDVKIYNCALSEKEVKRVPGVKKKWNFLIYMNADNNLETSMLKRLDDMERADFEDDMNILVLIDRIDGYNNGYEDWTGTKLLKLRRDVFGGDNRNYKLYCEVLKDYGELDMSDPKNLEDFVVYCQNNFPAERTILTIDNHGGGVSGFGKDYTTGDNMMGVAEERQSLSNAKAVTGQDIDILYHHACYMQTLEVLYELKDCANYIIGSETEGWSSNFDAFFFVQSLSQNTSVDTEDVLDIFEDSISRIIHSSVKTKDDSMQPFVAAFDAFCEELLLHNNYKEIELAYGEASKIGTEDWQKRYIDLISFVKAVSDNTTNQQLKTTAKNLENELYNIRCFYKTTLDPDTNYGISIYFPDTLTRWKVNKSWYNSDYDITEDTLWDEFLDRYHKLI